MASKLTWYGHATLGLETGGYTLLIDFNTFPVITQDPQAWVNQVQAEVSTQVHLLKPGESLTLS